MSAGSPDAANLGLERGKQLLQKNFALELSGLSTVVFELPELRRIPKALTLRASLLVSRANAIDAKHH